MSAVVVLAALSFVYLALVCAVAQPTDEADARAHRLVAAMTLDEKIGLLHTMFGVPLAERPAPKGSLGSAGFNPGVPRLGIPPLQETDAGLGIANPTNADYEATAMPSTLALGATFDPQLAYDMGSAIGAEARAMGFSVLLGGGANLVREPRGGRNFEYVSEDPLLTGAVVGASVAGTQSRHIVSTLKHFALNVQENGRLVLNAKLGEAALRESDLLAFEIAMERGAPGAVMTSYNRVNGAYTSENAHLLADILKGDWGFTGWVLADWGGTHSTEAAALAGLDQESGIENDIKVFFGEPLKAAVLAGRVPEARIDDMVFRLLRALIVAGVLDDPPRPGGRIDFDAHAGLARTIAARGMVLLKNDGVLPLKPETKRLLVVGGHADIGVLSGGGSSQVVPRGNTRFDGIPAKMFYGKPRLVDPSPPLAALRDAMKGTDIAFDDGHDVAAAARRAREADVAIVFADRWSNESLDLDGLTLPFDQDRLTAEVAAANPKTVVVLETPGAITMPWLGSVGAVVEAWYPGARGGAAIADVLTGRVNPSGRLPVTFLASEDDLPRRTMPARAGSASYPREAVKFKSFDVDYDIEGADVGYKWSLRKGQKPLFPFGYGLTYTRFSTSSVSAVAKNGTIAIGFDVTNIGPRSGLDVPQVYLDHSGFGRRLVGWETVSLAPGETKHVTVRVDPRLLARYDVAAHGWQVDAGRYIVSVRPDAMTAGPTVDVMLPDRFLPAQHGACGADAGPDMLCVGTR